jgi:hypothetical protein
MSEIITSGFEQYRGAYSQVEDAEPTTTDPLLLDPYGCYEQMIKG